LLSLKKKTLMVKKLLHKWDNRQEKKQSRGTQNRAFLDKEIEESASQTKKWQRNRADRSSNGGGGVVFCLPGAKLQRREQKAARKKRGDHDTKKLKGGKDIA